jgi:hypothetical protein
MAVRGDFKLNSVWYKSANGSLPNQQLANQMAEKVGQGTSSYADLSTWSAWIQEDWQEGVGKVKPNKNGGFLYGEAESRVPSQLILPLKINQVDLLSVSGTGAFTDCRYFPNATTYQTIGASQTNTKQAIRFTTPTVVGSTVKVWVYCRATIGQVLTFEFFANNSNLPTGAALASATVTVTEDAKGFAWHGVSIAYAGTLSNATTYWLAISPTTGTIDVGISNLTTATPTYPTLGSAGLQSSVWTALAAGATMNYMTSMRRMSGTVAANEGTGFFRFSNSTGVSSLYHYMRGHLYVFDEANDQWDTVANVGGGFLTLSIGQGINSAVVFPRNSTDGDSAFFGLGIGTNLVTYSAAGVWDAEVLIDDGPAIYGNTLLAKYGGYLYLGHGAKIYYYAPTYDAGGVTTDEMSVGSYSYEVTGMCGMGDSMYVSTSEALYRIAPGDFAVGVLPWDSPYGENGRAMVNYEGALYITANNRVVRVTEDHAIQDVWLTREEDLASGRIGRVHDLCLWDKWLVALCASDAAGSKPTLWARQDNSWHHIATLPAGVPGASDILKNYSIYFDRITDNLFVATPDQVTYRIATPQFASNPYNDSVVRYMPSAWMEWDWFDGQVFEAQKDYESVTIMGENFAAGQYVEVYWKDDDSVAWELLGTCDANNEELIWSTNRPNTKRLKLGILMFTTSAAETPRIRAIRVKYHLMVRDWFRWSLSIDVSGRTSNTQQMAEEKNTLTASQIKDNLDALAKLVPPFVYQDVDENLYLVKVNDANFTYTKYVVEGSTVYWEGVYRLVIEQVRSGEYTP